MPLPSDFDKYAHFISVVKASFNPVIEEIFKDIDETDLASVAGAFKQALLVQADDSFNLVLGRLILGFFGAGITTNLITADYYGTPKKDYKQNGIKAQVLIHFSEPEIYRISRKAKHPKRMNISINLKRDKSDISASFLDNIANKIKNNFPEPKNKNDLHYCGRKKYSYYDPSNGIQITQLTALNGKKAAEMIRKILESFDLPFELGMVNESKRLAGSNARREMVTGFVCLKSVTYVSDDPDETLVLRSSYPKLG